jgi:hypothetical protein
MGMGIIEISKAYNVASRIMKYSRPGVRIQVGHM